MYAFRPFRRSDAERLEQVFVDAVSVIGSRAYSAAQVAAWVARSPAAKDRIIERAELGHWIIVAVEESGMPVAYALLEQDGHLDHLYCHPDHTRNGLADRLLEAAEEQALTWDCKRLYTEASELARPAFERAGYGVTQRRDFTIEHEGKLVPIHNYAMEKTLG